MPNLPSSDKRKSSPSASKSIALLYEDKLHHARGRPLWKMWIEPTGGKLPTTKEANVKFADVNKSATETRTTNTLAEPKVRGIRCLTCACIGSVGLVEGTEDALDAFKSCTYNCGTAFLNSLPYTQKKKYKNTQTFERENFPETSTPLRSFNSPSELEKSHRGSSPGADSKHQFTSSSSEENGNLTLGEHADAGKNTSLAEEKRVFESSRQVSTAFENDSHFKNHTRSVALSTMKQQAAKKSIRHREKLKQPVGKKPVRVHLLNGESILLVFDPKAYVKEVFDQVCAMHSIKEGHFFGLSALVEGEHRFMDLKARLTKYAPKEWGKEPRRRMSDSSIQPSSVFTVQFQVQYFIEHPKLIGNFESRQHYYLQLKKNVLQSKVPVQDELIFTLAATALHLDKGQFDPEIHKGHYFDPHEYVPSWFLKRWDESYLWSHLPTMHSELTSTPDYVALSDYIKQASNIDDVPVHYYQLYKTKKESQSSVTMGIFHQGIRIHHVAQQRLGGPHLLDFEFPWSKVGRLFFAGKRFEIYPEDLPSSRKLTYYTGSRSRSKYLLRLLRDTHSLYMSLSPFVDHMRKVDGKSDRKRFRESYISGMNLEEKVKSGVGERLVGDTQKIPDVIRMISNVEENSRASTKSGTSQESSGTSGMESDPKMFIEDRLEEVNDAAFHDNDDPTELDTPSSGNCIQKKLEHLVAPLTKNSPASEVNAQMDNKGVVDAPKSSDKSPEDNVEGSQKEEEEFAASTSSSSPKRKISLSSVEKIFLDTNTMFSKTATLKKSSLAETPGGSMDKREVEDEGKLLASSSFIASEEKFASFLHDSNLDPASPVKRSNSTDVTSSTVPAKDDVLLGNGHAVVLRAISHDASIAPQPRVVHPRAKKGKNTHRRHQSAHDADIRKRDFVPNGKHFGAPLAPKKSFEDLTSPEMAPLSRSGRRGDIPSVLATDPIDPSAYHVKVTPISVPSNSRAGALPPSSDPSTAGHHRKSSDTGFRTPHHQTSNGTKSALLDWYRNDRRRSDIPGLTTLSKKSNGFVIGAAGHTPMKTEVLRSYPNAKNTSRTARAVKDVDLKKAESRSYFLSGSANSSPIYFEGYKEVIV